MCCEFIDAFMLQITMLSCSTEPHCRASKLFFLSRFYCVLLVTYRFALYKSINKMSEEFTVKYSI